MTAYDLTNNRPYLPGEVAARNALSDPKTPPEAKRAARDLLGYTDPLGWEWADNEPRWIDRLASAVLVLAVCGTIAMIVYVLTLPGALP